MNYKGSCMSGRTSLRTYVRSILVTKKERSCYEHCGQTALVSGTNETQRVNAHET